MGGGDGGGNGGGGGGIGEMDLPITSGVHGQGFQKFRIYELGFGNELELSWWSL